MTGSVVIPVGAVNSGASAGLRAAGQSAKLIVGDFDGDGRDDIFRGSVFLSTGTALSKQTWANADWGRIGDFNADGLADMFVLDGTNGTNSKLLLSNGAGFDVTALGQTLTNRANYHWPEFEDVSREPSTGYFPISSGNAYVTMDWGNSHCYVNIYGTMYSNACNTATVPYAAGGWLYYRGPEQSSTYYEGDTGSHYTWTYYLYRERPATSENGPDRLGLWSVADLNGDGASDLVQILETGGVRSLVSYTATGATLQKTTLIANLSGSAIGNEIDFSLLDVNGDRRAELVRPTGTTPSLTYTVRHFDGSSFPALYYKAAVASLYGAVGDYNGDTKLDLTQAFSAAPSGCAGCLAASTDSVVPDLMKRHTLSSGGTVDVEYLPSTYAANGYLPMVLQTVGKVTTGDGRGNSSATKYAYQGGAYDPFERKFLGFETVTAELPCETGETSCPWAIAKFRQEAVAAGALKRLEVYAGDGNMQRLIENGYVVNQTTAPFSAFKTSEQVTDYLVSGSVTTRKEWTYDGYANLLEENDLGVVGSTLDDLVTTTAYQLNLTDYLVAYPVQVTVKDAAAQTLRDTTFYYDGASSTTNSPVEGHITTTRRWLNPGNRWLVSTTSYDSFGQVTVEIDPLGNRTERAYDTATHQFVIEERNPLYFDGDTRQKTQTAWHSLCSQPTSATDVNTPRAGAQDGAILPANYVTTNRDPIVEYASAGAVTPQSADKDAELGRLQVTLSFVDTDVREFARVLFSELLHRPYTVDANIGGLVTVRSGGPVDGNAALTLARQALAATGNVILVSDGVYRVTSAQNGGASNGAGLRTFELKYIDASSAQAALQGLVQGRAEVVGANGRMLSMRGDAETLSLIESMLSTIDIDRFASASFGLFPLSSGTAPALAEELKALFQGAGVPTPTILAIDRVNALLIVATQASHLDFAKKWISRLDQAQRNERQVYVYQVKNRDAADLAKMLQGVLSGSSGEVHQVASIDPLSAGEGTPLTAPGGFLAAAETEASNGPTITADPATNTLLIWAKAAEFELLSRSLHRLDTAVSQVYVEATIAEVRLNGELSHGVRWFLESGGISAGMSDATNGAVASSFPGFNFALRVPRAQVVISALESHTDVRIVSTPQLTVVDRETATIQVGDQVPIVTKSVQDASSGNAVIANDVTFRDTGVILKVTPKVRSSGEVQLMIDQEVSRVVPTTSSLINSPTISQRKVSSTVLVPDGTAIVLAGLMSSTEEEGSGGLPGTQGSLLESIFGSKKTSAARSELIVIIRLMIIQDKGDLRDVAKEVASKMGEVLTLPAN